MFTQFAQFFAQSLETTTVAPNDPGSTAGSALLGLFYLIFGIVTIVALWKIFAKAGMPGWAALIPFYNTYILLKIAGKPGWWLLLFFIPFVNLVIAIIVGIEVAKRFGYGPVFGALLCGLLGIGYWIIGFGSSTYRSDPEPAA